MHVGPIQSFVSDQEGAIILDEFGAEIERFSIERHPRGTVGGPRRTARQEARSRFEGADVEDPTGLRPDLLTYSAYTPCQAVIGHHTRSFHELEDQAVAAVTGALDNSLSAMFYFVCFRCFVLPSFL